MCLSSERWSRDHPCFKTTAEKEDALLLCGKVKVGVLKKRKEHQLRVFLVGLCSHHHFLPPSRAGILPSSSLCFLLCRVLTCAAGCKGFVVYIQGFWEPQCPPCQVGTPITHPNVDMPYLWPHEPWSLCHAAIAQQWQWSVTAFRAVCLSKPSQIILNICLWLYSPSIAAFPIPACFSLCSSDIKQGSTT